MRTKGLRCANTYARRAGPGVAPAAPHPGTPLASSASSAGDKDRLGTVPAGDPGPPRGQGPGQAQGAEATPQAPVGGELAPRRLARGPLLPAGTPLRLPAAGAGSRALPDGRREAGLRRRGIPSSAGGGPVSRTAADQGAAGGRASEPPGRSEAPPSPRRAPVAPQASSPLAAAPRSHTPPRALPGAPPHLAHRAPHSLRPSTPHTPALGALTSVTGRQVRPRSPRPSPRAPPRPSEQGASEGVAGLGDGGEPARRCRLDSRSPLPGPVAPTPARPPAGNAPRPRAVPGY